MIELKSAAFMDATSVAYAPPYQIESTSILHSTVGGTNLETAVIFT